MKDRNVALTVDAPMASCICVIPSRLASTRLSRKPLVDLAGKALIIRVCDNVRASGVFDRIVVACDAVEVFDIVQIAGYEAVMTPPDLPSGTDRVNAAAQLLAIDAQALVINVQGDEPFVSKATLSAVVNGLRRADEHTIVTARELIQVQSELHDPNLVKIAVGNADRAVYFSRASIPFVRDPKASDQYLTDQHFRHIGIYAYRFATLRQIASLPVEPLEDLEKLEQLRWLANGYDIRAVLVEPSARGIDTPEDLVAANQHYRRLHHA